MSSLMATICALCHSPLVLDREHYDRQDAVFVGELHCPRCARRYLDQRRQNETRVAIPTIATDDVAPGPTIDNPVDRQHPGIAPKGPTMRFFDTDRVGCYLDGVNLRLERTKDAEHKVIDLTLRVQPFTPELATALHPDVRALLFSMTEATPKPLLKSVELRLPNLAKQHLDCFTLPEEHLTVGAFTLLDAEMSDPRVRTEKGVDGYALVFYATIGPVGKEELEYVTNWYTQQRFVTFRESQAVMDFAGKAEGDVEAKAPRRAPKTTQGEAVNA